MHLFRPHRINIKIAATVFSSILVVYVGTSMFGASACMQIPRLPLVGSPAFVGLSFQDVSFTSRVDHVELKGWFLPSSNDSAILIVNGGFQNRLDPVANTLNLAHDLVNKGYNILLFNLRGRGESLGKGYSLSYEDRDIGGAIDYLNSKGYPPSKIGILGDCSGAANTCIFASKEEVGGIVLDGCFTSVTDMVYHQASCAASLRFL